MNTDNTTTEMNTTQTETAMEQPISIPVELTDEDSEFTCNCELSPEGIRLNTNNWNLFDQIHNEIAPIINSKREAYAQLFKRFEDRYFAESFEGLTPIPSYISDCFKDNE